MNKLNLERIVAFYETDAMGVVHHANYLRFFEDARLAWLQQLGLLQDYKKPGALNFAVVEANLEYRKPARYGDRLQVRMQVHAEGAKLYFRYEILGEDLQAVCVGSSVHVTVDGNLQPKRIPKEILNHLGEQHGS